MLTTKFVALYERDTVGAWLGGWIVIPGSIVA